MAGTNEQRKKISKARDVFNVVQRPKNKNVVRSK